MIKKTGGLRKNRLVSVAPNLQQKWLARIRSNPIISVILLIATIISAFATFGDKVTTIPATFRKIWPGPIATISTGLYALEVANKPSTYPPVLFEEVRDLSTGCRIFQWLTVGTENGPWASPGVTGARATVLLKIRIGNTSQEKLSNIRVDLSPGSWPFDFTSIASSPNVVSKLARAAPALGGPSNYVLSIDSLPSDDFAVLTLSAPLTRENATKVLSRHLEMHVLSVRADQFHSSAPKIARKMLSARDLYLEENLKTTGRPGVSLGSEVEIVANAVKLQDKDLPLLPASSTCPE